MRGRGPKIGGFGDVWDVYGPGRAAGCGVASSRCVLVLGVVERREHHIILKKNQPTTKTIWPQNHGEKAEGFIQGS